MDGIFAIFAGIASRRYFERWWAVLLEGVAGVVIGLLTFFWPNITALVLLYFIAAWALITGIFEIVAAIQLRRVITGEWMMILGGLLSILFGVSAVRFSGRGCSERGLADRHLRHRLRNLGDYLRLPPARPAARVRDSRRIGNMMAAY